MIGHEIRLHLSVLYGAGVALLIVVLLTPAVGGMARLLGAVDRPGERRRHGRTVPRLGGLALFLGIFVPALAFLHLDREMRGLLLGAAVATTVGAVDDFRGLTWWEKLGGQVQPPSRISYEPAAEPNVVRAMFRGIKLEPNAELRT